VEHVCRDSSGALAEEEAAGYQVELALDQGGFMLVSEWRHEHEHASVVQHGEHHVTHTCVGASRSVWPDESLVGVDHAPHDAVGEMEEVVVSSAQVVDSS
jgi:hypothetical protein